jgi:hypothetical protein
LQVVGLKAVGGATCLTVGAVTVVVDVAVPAREEQMDDSQMDGRALSEKNALLGEAVL